MLDGRKCKGDWVWLVLFCISIMAVTVLFFGCASTSLTSYLDPDYRAININKVIVYVLSNDIRARDEVETEIADSFYGYDVEVIKSIELFPPTREYTTEQMVEIMQESGAQALLAVGVGDAGSEEVYIPQTSSTTKTSGNVNVYGNSATYKQKSKTSYSGGYTVNKPWAQFETKMIDISNGRTIWIASAFSGGNAYANDYTLIRSFCDEMTTKLEEDGLIIWSEE